MELAPRHERLAYLTRAVNDALALDWSDAAWRGLLQRNPSTQERLVKLLGTAERTYPNALRLVGNGRGIVFSDIHAPFHDTKAVALAAKVAAWWNPQLAIWNGDDLDCYRLSRFSQNPERTERLQQEIDLWHIEVMAPLLAALAPSPKTPTLVAGSCLKVKLPGNHEGRLQDALWANPGLFGLRAMELASLLELKRLGVLYAHTKVLLNGALEISHGTKVRPQAGASARAECERRRYSISTITGHVHRAGSYLARTASGWVRAQEAPCLCRLDPEYSDDPDWVDWAQGVTLFQVFDQKVVIEPVVFFSDYTCMVGKQIFSL